MFSIIVYLNFFDTPPFALILGIDRFMSEARAITNLIGNSVATLVIAKWEKEIDLEVAKKEIH